jgi:DNA primase small subunit
MKIYYRREVFPFKSMFEWLSYGKGEYAARREWSYTLPGGRGRGRGRGHTDDPFCVCPGDVYVRFHSYEEMEEWKRGIVDRNPIKIDIGAVYSLPPKHRGNYDPAAFVPQERELVFDIDMDEYNK